MKLRNKTIVTAISTAHLKYILNFCSYYIWSCYDKFNCYVASGAKSYLNNGDSKINVLEAFIKFLC